MAGSLILLSSTTASDDATITITGVRLEPESAEDDGEE